MISNLGVKGAVVGGALMFSSACGGGGERATEPPQPSASTSISGSPGSSGGNLPGGVHRLVVCDNIYASRQGGEARVVVYPVVQLAGRAAVVLSLEDPIGARFGAPLDQSAPGVRRSWFDSEGHEVSEPTCREREVREATWIQPRNGMGTPVLIKKPGRDKIGPLPLDFPAAREHGVVHHDSGLDTVSGVNSLLRQLGATSQLR